MMPYGAVFYRVGREAIEVTQQLPQRDYGRGASRAATTPATILWRSHVVFGDLVWAFGAAFHWQVHRQGHSRDLWDVKLGCNAASEAGEICHDIGSCLTFSPC
jgi:hypothetical protein